MAYCLRGVGRCLVGFRALVGQQCSSGLPCISVRHKSRGMQPIPDKEPTWMSAEEAVAPINSGMRVYIQTSAATPLALVEAMTKHGLAQKLKGVEVVHMQTEGVAEYAQPHCEGIFRSNSFFIGQNVRGAVNEGRGDFVPVFLSEVPLLFRRGLIELDVALVTLSPPDKHGFCTLATSCDTSVAAIQAAKYVVGQVNANAPRVFGDGVVHISQMDAVVQADTPYPQMTSEKRIPSEIEDKIGKLLADNLIDDGATLQVGIGRIPHAVLGKMKHHRDLGIHSEMISDALIRLVKTGQVTNARKVIEQGKIVGTFAFGSNELYSFMNNNPSVVLGCASWVAKTSIIAQNPKVTAINTCIETDITGQVCADSIGRSMYTGFGGQADFIRGAALGQDGLGKAVIAMPSLAPNGESKIVAALKEGAGVVTTRAHVHYVVTEYGIAHLFGKTLRQRAYELIRVSHPKYREQLEKAAFERLRVMPTR